MLFSGNSDSTSSIHEPELEHVHGFSVDVANPERLLIATHHGLLALEGGTLTQVGTSQDDFMGFTPHPSNASVLFSSGHSQREGNLGFQKSVDGGQSWQKVSDGLSGPVDFHSMAVSAVNPDIVYGYFGQLQRSTDGGQHWEIATGAVQPISLTSDPTRENIVYAATQSGVLVSNDKADSWKSLSPQLEGAAVSTIAFEPSGGYALTFSLKLGGMGKSTDGGVTWKKLNESFGGGAVMYIAFSTMGSSTYALTESNAIYKSTDTGETWSKVR